MNELKGYKLAYEFIGEYRGVTKALDGGCIRYDSLIGPSYFFIYHIFLN